VQYLEGWLGLDIDTPSPAIDPLKFVIGSSDKATEKAASRAPSELRADTYFGVFSGLAGPLAVSIFACVDGSDESK
jgi:hypothetical protein